jgi:cytochrome c oxidase cbb3-type subunit 3
VKSTRDELLNHDADGIREFDNALPRWWLYGFYFTILFAVVYFANYHLLPAPLFGRSSIAAEYNADLEAAALAAKSRPSKPGAAVVALTDHDSLEKGRAIFEGPSNVCFSCHRADMGGLVGPNLTDEYWLHGCSPADLVRSVSTGFPIKGMLPYGTGKVLTDDEVLQVVSYVISRRGSNPANPKPTDPTRDQVCR